MCIHIYIHTPVFSFLLVQSCSHNCLRLIVDVSSFISVYLPPGRSKSLARAPRIQRFPNQWTTDHLGTQRGHRRPKKLSETSISNHLNGRFVVFQDLKHVGVQIGYRPISGWYWTWSIRLCSNGPGPIHVPLIVGRKTKTIYWKMPSFISCVFIQPFKLMTLPWRQKMSQPNMFDWHGGLRASFMSGGMKSKSVRNASGTWGSGEHAWNLDPLYQHGDTSCSK